MVHLNPRLPAREDVNDDNGPAGGVSKGRPDTPSLSPRLSGNAWCSAEEDASGSENGAGDADVEGFDTTVGVDETVDYDDGDEEVTGLVRDVDETAATWDGTTQLLEEISAEDPPVEPGSPSGEIPADSYTQASQSEELHATGESTIHATPELPPPAPLSSADAHQKWLRENLRSLKKARRKIDILRVKILYLKDRRETKEKKYQRLLEKGE